MGRDNILELEKIKDVDILKFKKNQLWLIYGFGLCLYFIVMSLSWFMKLPQLDWPTSLFPIIVVVPLVILHELFHGLSFVMFGKKMRFGFKIQHVFDMMFYTTSPGSILSKNKMNFVTLSPQIMTIISLIILLFIREPILSNCLLTFAAINLAGGCADIYMVALICKQKGDVYVEDTGTGATLYRKVQNI